MVPRSPTRSFSDRNTGTKPKQVSAEKRITRAAARAMQASDIPSNSEGAVGGDATGSLSLKFPDTGRHQERDPAYNEPRHAREVDESGNHDVPPPPYHESVQTPSIERMLAQFKAEMLGLCSLLSSPHYSVIAIRNPGSAPHHAETAYSCERWQRIA